MYSNRNVSRRSIASSFIRSGASVLGLCALVSSVAVNAASPRIITIDAPGAGTGQNQGTGCSVTDCSVLINDFGEITGYYLDANNAFHGFVRAADGRFSTFDAPGADTTAGDFNGTFPNAINDAGYIAGTYFDINNASHGFLRSPEGGFTTFDVPGSLAGSTSGIALNLFSEVVGYYVTQSGVFQGYLRRSDGTFDTWAGPNACDMSPANGCYGTGAIAINLFGTITGGYEDNSGNFVGHGLVRDPRGNFTAFTAPGAGTGQYQGTSSPGSSLPINLFGDIAGTYIDANSVVHGFVRSAYGSFATFDPPGEGPNGIGCYSDCSLGLNDSGAITGYYADANGLFHGYVRSPGGEFFTFDAPGASGGTFPVSINDLGMVTGLYVDANSALHGFLLLPPY